MLATEFFRHTKDILNWTVKADLSERYQSDIDNPQGYPMTPLKHKKLTQLQSQ